MITGGHGAGMITGGHGAGAGIAGHAHPHPSKLWPHREYPWPHPKIQARGRPHRGRWVGGDGVFVYYHFRSVGMILFIMIDHGSMRSWIFRSQGMLSLLCSVIMCVSVVTFGHRGYASISTFSHGGLLLLSCSVAGYLLSYHVRSREYVLSNVFGDGGFCF